MKQIVLVIAVALLLTACSKEQSKKVEIRPVRVTSVQHALSGDTISLTDRTAHIQQPLHARHHDRHDRLRHHARAPRLPISE